MCTLRTLLVDMLDGIARSLRSSALYFLDFYCSPMFISDIRAYIVTYRYIDCSCDKLLWNLHLKRIHAYPRNVIAWLNATNYHLHIISSLKLPLYKKEKHKIKIKKKKYSFKFRTAKNINNIFITLKYFDEQSQITCNSKH